MPGESEFREQIAIEAARLLARGKVQSFATARKRASRWLKRQGLTAADIPSNTEIQQQLYALEGIFGTERRASAWLEKAIHAGELMSLCAPHEVRLGGPLLQGQSAEGVRLELWVREVSRDVIVVLLREQGEQVELIEGSGPDTWTIELPELAALLHGVAEWPTEPLWTLDDLALAVARFDQDRNDDSVPSEEEQHAALEVLLAPLARVMLEPIKHPEGDALYHSLQVFELGLNELPYDEEFLLACLLHEGGLAIDPRHPAEALADAIEGLVTPRTLWLIEQLPLAAEYLRTGKVPRNLQRHEDWDDLLTLARCDRAGRVCGAQVRTLPEALAAIRAAAHAYDEPDEPEPDQI